MNLRIVIASLILAQVGQIPAWPPVEVGTVGCPSSPVIITTVGAGTRTVPPNCGHLVPDVWAGGGDGGLGGAQTSGGGGGGYGVYTSLVVTPGATVYYSVGAAGANSWINISASPQPSSAGQGVFATHGGAGGASAGTGGTFGPIGGGSHATGFTGGNGAPGPLGGGGGGAGSAGNGTGGTGGGTGGTPDGGNGGAGGVSGGNGVVPGGGGAGAGGLGASGKVRFAWST